MIKLIEIKKWYMRFDLDITMILNNLHNFLLWQIVISLFIFSSINIEEDKQEEKGNGLEREMKSKGGKWKANTIM